MRVFAALVLVVIPSVVEGSGGVGGAPPDRPDPSTTLGMTVMQPGQLLVATSDAIDRHDTRGRFLESTPRHGGMGTLLVEGDTRLLVNQSIRRVNADGTLGEPFAPELNAPEGVTVDRAGNVYTIDHETLVKLDREGRVVSRIPFDGEPAFDLARDQCTLYHVRSERERHGTHRVFTNYFIARFDVCSSRPLGDVMPLGRNTPFDLRVVRGGLLMSLQSDEVLYVDFRGKLITRYTGQRLFRIAIDRSGSTFWAGQGTMMRQFRLGDPRPVRIVRTGQDHMIHSLAVVDGWRASRRR